MTDLKTLVMREVKCAIASTMVMLTSVISITAAALVIMFSVVFIVSGSTFSSIVYTKGLVSPVFLLVCFVIVSVVSHLFNKLFSQLYEEWLDQYK